MKNSDRAGKARPAVTRNDKKEKRRNKGKREIDPSCDQVYKVTFVIKHGDGQESQHYRTLSPHYLADRQHILQLQSLVYDSD